LPPFVRESVSFIELALASATDGQAVLFVFRTAHANHKRCQPLQPTHATGEVMIRSQAVSSALLKRQGYNHSTTCNAVLSCGAERILPRAGATSPAISHNRPTWWARSRHVADREICRSTQTRTRAENVS